jgi:small multidrug resistance pump
LTRSGLSLVLATVLEVSGTTARKLPQGITKVLPFVLMFLCYELSLSALTLAFTRIEVSVTYAVWSGLGTALIAPVGVLWLKEVCRPCQDRRSKSKAHGFSSP